MLVVAPARAATCDDSTLSQEDCLEKAVAAAKARMNAATKLLRTRAQRIDPTALYFLSEAQKRWSSYMDLNCRSESFDAFGGSLMETLELQCQARLLNERARELRTLNERLRKGLRMCPIYKSPDADQVEYGEAVKELVMVLGRFGDALNSEQLFDVDVRETITRTFNEAQITWRSAQTHECFSRYLLFCGKKSLSIRERDAWLMRCEASKIRARTREFRTRMRSLNDALDSNAPPPEADGPLSLKHPRPASASHTVSK